MTNFHFLNASRARTAIIWIMLAWIAGMPLLTLWNLSMGKIQPKLRVHIGKTLAGVVVPPVIPHSLWDSFKHGTLQKAVADFATQSVAYRPLLIRLNNEIIFSIFLGEPEANILRGDRDVLIELPYLREYCSRSLVNFLPKAQAWARNLREIQDYYTARGSTFLYVITPSKAVSSVAAFRNRYPCLNNARERDEFLPHYAAILSAAGVNVVDTATLTATLVNRGIAAFPRGGAHWNSLVAADATQELIGKLNQLSPFLQIPLLAWRSYTSSKPRDSDRDLVDLLNLLRGWSDEVPELEFASSNSCDRKINATIVGGSFMPIIAEMLTKTGCVERVDLYFYLHVSLVRSPGMRVLKRDLKSADIVVIKEAPVIILEENELVMPRSDHGLAFYNLIFRGPK